jgi:hypothetical protein
VHIGKLELELGDKYPIEHVPIDAGVGGTAGIAGVPAGFANVPAPAGIYGLPGDPTT